MSKRQVYLFCVLITVFGWIYYKTHTIKPALPLKTNPSNLSSLRTKSLLTWQGQSVAAAQNYSTQNTTKMNIQNIMAGSYISPFSQHSNPDNLSSNYSAAKIEFQTGLKVVTYSNLNNFSESSTSSRFICPPDTPFAESYILVNPLQNVFVSAKAYRNFCVFGGGGIAFADILYGDDQHVDPNHGEANNASAFVPVNTPEGCNVAENNIFVDILVPESTIQVTPIYAEANPEKQIIGYQQTQQIQPNCIGICNNLIKTYCNKLDKTLYCANIIVNAYLKKSVYLARNITENFCACSISSIGSPYPPFTNAIDVESLINYNNPLSSVTCSNYATQD
ncbi:MAG: hypothetical protein K2Y14_05735 [Burkholderiales bacterium]|nr:hypothetical protein [Burkholderiales bacterium]